MGLGTPKKIKELLQTRASTGWIKKEQLENPIFRDNVTFIIVDFLLNVHRFGYNGSLTYSLLVHKIQSVILSYVKVFPNVKTIILLLDEQRYVPLGKIPTQDKRRKPLTPRERSKILDGGTISSMDPTLQDSIDTLYEKEADVKSKKKTSFSVFFERYIRTRELRKDLVTFITKCLIKLIETHKVPDSVRIYIDGMSVSTYFASPNQLFSDTMDDDGTRLVKRSRSISTMEDVDAHGHHDQEHLSVCKLVWSPRQNSLSLTASHPSSSMSQEELSPKQLRLSNSFGKEMEVQPLWLTREEGDSEIFMGYKGPFERPNMGESDVKIAYYARRVAETLSHQSKESREGESDEAFVCTCLVSSWDTDIIPILLLHVQEFPSSVAEHFDILLDTKPGGSVGYLASLMSRDSQGVVPLESGTTLALSPNGSIDGDDSEEQGVYSHVLGRTVWESEGEFLTEVINIQLLAKGIRQYFSELHPMVPNAVDTLCFLMILNGSDFADSPSGIGFEKLRTVFDLGGYVLLSSALSIETVIEPSENGSKCGRTFSSIKRVSVNVNEDNVKAFFNLVYRYALGLGGVGDIKKAILREKRRLTDKIKEVDRHIKDIRGEDTTEEQKKGRGSTGPSSSWTRKRGKERERSRGSDHMTSLDFETLDTLEHTKGSYQRKRESLNRFILDKHYKELEALKERPDELTDYIKSTLGMDKGAHMDWSDIETTLRSKKIARIMKKRNVLVDKAKENQEKEFKKVENIRRMSEWEILKLCDKRMSDFKNQKKIGDFAARSANALVLKHQEAQRGYEEEEKKAAALSDWEVFSKLKRDISDLQSEDEICSNIRRMAWNMCYWRLSTFVCMRETKHLNSMCSVNPALYKDFPREENSTRKNLRKGIEDFFDLPATPRKEATDSGHARDKCVSLNGFHRVYVRESSSSAGVITKRKRQEDKAPRKTTVVKSGRVFPAGKVVVDLVSV